MQHLIRFVVMLLLFGGCNTLFAQVLADRQKIDIVVTTPGYAAIYRYSPDEFSAGVTRDFRLPGTPISVEMEPVTADSLRMELRVGQRRFSYGLGEKSSVVRLMYDRNRRLFSGMGFNFLENDSLRYEAPRFKGQEVTRLAETWKPQIKRLMTDQTLLQEGCNRFMLEAEIDENGIVHRIVELNGGLRQYAKILIDHMYDVAVRGWEPAKRNGIPYRTVVQIPFDIYKEGVH